MSEGRMLIGLIGANIMGSLSPALFADAFAAAGIDGFYHLMDIDRLPERRLARLLDSIKTAGFIGTNITFPFKQDVMPLLDAIDTDAAEVGAVNTVAVAADGRSTGYNFDRLGFRRSFEESLGRGSAKGATVIEVGAGGAGRAVAFALMDLEIERIVIYDQDAARARSLAADITTRYGASHARISADLVRDITTADGIVNATQLGMRGFPGNPVPTAALKTAQWAADVIYTPAQTTFLAAATAKGLRTMNGGGMCVYQAVAAFRLFTGVEPDAERLHRTFASALAERDKAWAELA